MMVSAGIVLLFRLPLDNNSYSSCISYEVGLIRYFIHIISSDMTIYDVDMKSPDVDLIVIWF